MTDLAGRDEITAITTGMVGLRAKGIKADNFMRYLGFEPEELRAMAAEAADEEFDVLPGMPPGFDATGRLRKLGLSANQRATVKEALVETYLSAIETGVVFERVRQETSPRRVIEDDLAPDEPY